MWTPALKLFWAPEVTGLPSRNRGEVSNYRRAPVQIYHHLGHRQFGGDVVVGRVAALHLPWVQRDGAIGGAVPDNGRRILRVPGLADSVGAGAMNRTGIIAHMK